MLTFSSIGTLPVLERRTEPGTYAERELRCQLGSGEYARALVAPLGPAVLVAAAHAEHVRLARLEVVHHQVVREAAARQRRLTILVCFKPYRRGSWSKYRS